MLNHMIHHLEKLQVACRAKSNNFIDLEFSDSARLMEALPNSEATNISIFNTTAPSVSDTKYYQENPTNTTFSPFTSMDCQLISSYLLNHIVHTEDYSSLPIFDQRLQSMHEEYMCMDQASLCTFFDGGQSSGFGYPRMDSTQMGSYVPMVTQSDIQMIGDRLQQLPISDASSVEDQSTKVGRLSAEERKKKINRYMKKRNERNFSKKIKYACRKTLADSRPRVRGRFAKNEELGESVKPGSSDHDFDGGEEALTKF